MEPAGLSGFHAGKNLKLKEKDASFSKLAFHPDFSLADFRDPGSKRKPQTVSHSRMAAVSLKKLIEHMAHRFFIHSAA